MFLLEWLSEEGVLLEVDHAESKITACLEVVIVLCDLFLGERLVLDSGPGGPEGSDGLNLGHGGRGRCRSLAGRRLTAEIFITVFRFKAS